MDVHKNNPEADMSEPTEPDTELTEDDRKGADVHPPASGNDEDPTEDQ